jgi:hypothetical protein
VTRAQLERCSERHPMRWRNDQAPILCSVLPGLEDGWLSFESWKEKRRLIPPFPPGWRDLPTCELRRLCERAALVTSPRPPRGFRRNPAWATDGPSRMD